MAAPKDSRIEFANSLRGFAALGVALGHFGGMFWTKPEVISYFTGTPILPTQNPLPWFSNIVLWPINVAVVGVAAFFLISGLVIPISIGRSSTVRFLAARVMRLFPTYMVCFTIVLAAIGAGSWYFGTSWPPISNSDIAIHFLPGLRALFGSRDIDGVVWTLEVELCFYLMCALAAPLFRRQSVLVFAIPVALAVAASIPNIRPDFVVSVSPYLVFMFIGVCFYYLHTGAISGVSAIAVFSVTIASTAVASFGVLQVSYMTEVAVSYLVGLAIFTLAYRFPNFVPKGRAVNFMANISYPFYLVHAIPGYVLMLIIVGGGGVSRTFAVAAAICFGAVIAAAVHYLVELPTRRMSSDIQRNTPPIAATKLS